MTTLYWKGGQFLDPTTGRACISHGANWCTDIGLTTRWTGTDLAGHDLRLDGTGTIESRGETRCKVSFKSLYGVRTGTDRSSLLVFNHLTTMTGGVGANFVDSTCCVWADTIELHVTGVISARSVLVPWYMRPQLGAHIRFISGNSSVPAGATLCGRIHVSASANLDFSGATLLISPSNTSLYNLNFSYAGSTLDLSAAGTIAWGSPSTGNGVRGYVKGAITVTNVTVEGALLAFDATDGGGNGATVYFSVLAANPDATTLYWKGGGAISSLLPGHYKLESPTNWCTDAALTTPFSGSAVTHCDLRFDSSGTIVGPACADVNGYFFSSIYTPSSYPAVASLTYDFTLHGKGASDVSVLDSDTNRFSVPPFPIFTVDDVSLYSNGSEPSSLANEAAMVISELGAVSVPSTETLFLAGIKVGYGASLDFQGATLKTVAGVNVRGFRYQGLDLDFSSDGTLIVGTPSSLSSSWFYSTIESEITVSHVDASGGMTVVATSGPATDDGDNENLLFLSALYWNGGETVAGSDWDFCAPDNWCVDESLTVPFDGATIDGMYLRLSGTTQPESGNAKTTRNLSCISLDLPVFSNAVLLAYHNITLTFAEDDCPLIIGTDKVKFYAGTVTVAPVNSTETAECASSVPSGFSTGLFANIVVLGGTFKIGYSGSEDNDFGCGNITLNAGSALAIGGDTLWVVGNADTVGPPNTGHFTFNGSDLTLASSGVITVLNDDNPYRAAVINGTINVAFIDASGGIPIYANSGPATDGGDNYNVVFGASTPTTIYWNDLNETGDMTDPSNWSTDQDGTTPYGGADFIACDLLFTGTGAFSGNAATASTATVCGSLDARSATCAVSLNGLAVDGMGDFDTTYLTDSVTFTGGSLLLHHGVTLSVSSSSSLALTPIRVTGDVTIEGDPCRVEGSSVLGCSVLLDGNGSINCTNAEMRLTDSATYPAVLPEAGRDGIYGSGLVYVESDRFVLPTQVDTDAVTLLFTGSTETTWAPPELEPDILSLSLGNIGNEDLHLELNTNLEQLEAFTLFTTNATPQTYGMFVTATEDIRFVTTGYVFSVLANNVPIDIDWSTNTIDIFAYLFYWSAVGAVLSTLRGDGITRVTHEITVTGTPDAWEPTASAPRFVSSVT